MDEVLDGQSDHREKASEEVLGQPRARPRERVGHRAVEIVDERAVESDGADKARLQKKSEQTSAACAAWVAMPAAVEVTRAKAVGVRGQQPCVLPLRRRLQRVRGDDGQRETLHQIARIHKEGERLRIPAHLFGPQREAEHVASAGDDGEDSERQLERRLRVRPAVEVVERVLRRLLCRSIQRKRRRDSRARAPLERRDVAVRTSESRAAGVWHVRKTWKERARRDAVRRHRDLKSSVRGTLAT
mmetsp:Transcript_994/g.2279  ORF Transcript_994/g.2279 Transcript_994/m.2279 type:complete len:244 (+) Transcript_994:437-1168(+)